jgi:RNA polymerase sigma-70 factor (ECF subfamily)
VTQNVRSCGLSLRTISHAMSTRPTHVPLSLVVGRDPRATSDGELARALTDGAVWAAAESWRRFAPMVLALAKRTLGSASEAEDIGQEVFHRVYRKIGTLREPDSFRNFVYTCALRVLQTELHRKRMRSWLSFERPEVLDDRVSESLDMESRDLLRRFYGALERLAPRDRLVFMLRRVEAQTVEEIAAALEISESTVKRSLTRASNRLSRWMDDRPRLPDGERPGG